MRLLEEFGIEYDHSMMHHDCQPYYVGDAVSNNVPTDYTKDMDTWMVPMTKLQTRNVVEIPASWSLDDWPPLQYSGRSAGTHGFVDVGVVQRSWEEQFDYFYREYESFVFCVSVHPQVSGRAHVMLMHERFLAFLKGHEGVEFCPCEKICEEFKAERLGGVTISGGV